MKTMLSTKNLFFRLLPFVLIAMLPIQLGRHFFLPFSYVLGVRVDYLSLTIYLTDILALFLIAGHLPYLARKLSSKRFLALILILAGNTLFSLIPEISLYTSLKLLEVLCLYFIFQKIRLPRQHILLAFLTGAVFELALVVLQFTRMQSLQGLFYFAGERFFTLQTPGIAKASFLGRELLRPYGTFSHPNSLGGFYLAVYLYALTVNKGRTSPLLTSALLLVSASLVFISFSKAAFASLALLTVIYLIRTKLACTLCRVARSAVFIVLFFIVLMVQTDPLTLHKRLSLLGQSLRLFWEYPFMGTGLGTYTAAAGKHPPLFLDSLNQPVHSVPFLFLTEMGIVVGLVGYLLLPFVKRCIRTAPYLVAALLLTGVVDHYWLTLKQNMLLVGILMGLL